MDQGWVYVLVNSTMPGFTKVGCTTRSPAERAAELSSATGVAVPFVVAFDRLFEDCCAAEQAIHQELDRRGLRLAGNREFFNGSPSEIIRVVLEAGDIAGRSVAACGDASGEALLCAGDDAFFGRGEAMQDEGEALRLYRLAAARGSLIAFERLGDIYWRLYVKQRDRVGRRRLMAALKEGARRGNYYCFTEMATAFAAEEHTENFTKAWALFFQRRQEMRLGVLEADDSRFITACCRYIAMCLELGLRPAHRDEMGVVAERLIAALLKELDEVRDNDFGRRRVTSVLRWTCQSLLPPAASATPANRLSLGRLARIWGSRTEMAGAA